MHHDIAELRLFYYQRALGRVVQRLLRDRLMQLWPVEGVTGMTLAGYGFAVPMLRPYLVPARRVMGLMPAAQGVMAWPVALPNHSLLCEPTAWPLETGIVDRLVILHGLETADDPAALLAEAWRVLGPGGRAVLMVPNRAGLWARSDATPFGIGRSYSAGQIERQARRAGFVVDSIRSAVYVPPSDRRFWLRTAQWWEDMAARMPAFVVARMLVAGVLIVELSKQVPARIEPGAGAIIRKSLGLLEGTPVHVGGVSGGVHRHPTHPYKRPQSSTTDRMDGTAGQGKS